MNWYAQHKATLADYLAENEEELGEWPYWWLQMLLMNVSFNFICRTAKETQGKAVLSSEQSFAINDLYIHMLELYNVTLTEDYATATVLDAINPGAFRFGSQEATLGPHNFKDATLFCGGQGFGHDVEGNDCGT